MKSIALEKKTINRNRKWQVASASKSCHKKQDIAVNMAAVSNTGNHMTAEDHINKGQDKVPLSIQLLLSIGLQTI